MDRFLTGWWKMWLLIGVASLSACYNLKRDERKMDWGWVLDHPDPLSQPEKK